MEETVETLIVLAEQLYFNIFKKRLTVGRNRAYPIKHYFTQIFYVLQTGISWRKLRVPLHWTTYYKFHQQCCQIGFFSLLHTTVICVLEKTDRIEMKNMYIDSTMIKNIGGVDFLGKNHYDRNRKGNKITVIISENGIPLSMSMTTANVADVKEVLPCFENIQIQVKVGSRLIGDKGYVSNKRVLKSKKITYLYPNKNNVKRKRRFGYHQKRAMQKRWKVENCFAHFRNYRKIDKRWDKDYEQWVMMALSIIALRRAGI